MFQIEVLGWRCHSCVQWPQSGTSEFNRQAGCKIEVEVVKMKECCLLLRRLDGHRSCGGMILAEH